MSSIRSLKLALLFAISLMASCGGTIAQLTQDDWNHRAKETIKLVRSWLDINELKHVTLAKLDEAVRKMEPIMAHPEIMRLQVKQEFSFDATPPVQTSVGPSDIVLTVRQILHAYERLGAWDKAGDVTAKALQFADRFNQSHPPSKKSYSLDDCVSDYEYVALYREYARCLERSGKLDKSREYSKLALAKLTGLDKGKQSAVAATGWAATVADSNRRSFAFEYDDLGIIGLERGDSVAEIEPLLKRAIQLQDEQAEPSDSQAESMQHLGLALMKEKRYTEARHYYQLAFDIMQKPQRWINSDRVADSAAGLARCYWLEGKHKQAISTLKTALEKCLRTQSASESLARSWTQLAYYFKATGDLQEADQALRVASEKITDLEQYAAGLRQSCHIIYLADATDAQVARIRSDIKVISGQQPVQLDYVLRSFGAEFPPFDPPLDSHLGPVYRD